MAKSYKTTFIIDGDGSGAVKAQRAVRNESAALTRELERAERQSEQMNSSFESVSRRATQLTTFLGGAAAAIGTLATRQTLAIAEQQNLARSLDVSVQTLQEWQFAANQVGVGSDKLGDIFKDTSDKLGDFVSTGGGEAADLFEKLNLDAAKLINMSPDQQLLAIGRALEGVDSQAQRVFFMESIADDASRLLPLLENNGELLRENAQLARQLGVSIPQDDVDSIKDAGDALKELQGVGTGFANVVATQAAPAIRNLTDEVKDAIDELGGMNNVVDTSQAGIAALATLLGARLAGSLATAAAATARKTAADIAAAQAEARSAQASEAAAQATVRRTAAEAQSAKALLRTAQLEANATRGTNAHATALNQLSAARVRAAEAAAAHTAATRTASAAADTSTAAMGRASVAARGLSGAMALVGGPIGLLIGGGALLYTFRDELNLTGQRLGLTEEQVRDFRDELGDLSSADMSGSLDSLNSELEEATLKAAAARDELNKLRQESNDPGPWRNSIVLGQDADERKAAFDALATAKQNLAEIEQKRNMTRVTLWGRWADTVVNATSATDDNTRAITQQSDAAEQLEKKYQSLESQLREQIATFGDTTEAARVRYQVEQGGLSEISSARKRNLIQMAQELDNLEQQRAAAQALFPQLEKLRALSQQSDAIDQMDGNLGNLARRQMQNQLGSVAMDGAPKVQGLDPEYSGAFGEANRLDSEMAEYQSWYQQRLEMLREFENEKYGVQAEATAAREALEKQHQQTVRQYEMQSHSARLQGYSSLFGNLANLTGQFAGEQSGIYQAMFAASKAFAIADSIIKIQQGIANASAMPFPANLAAMATVAANTASIVSTIQGTSMGSVSMPSGSGASGGGGGGSAGGLYNNVVGQAHDGIDNTRAGTWLLDDNERVVDARTNRDLKQYLARSNQDAKTSGAAALSGTAKIEQHFHVQGNPDDQQLAALKQAAQQGAQQGYQMVLNDFKSRGPIRKTAGV